MKRLLLVLAIVIGVVVFALLSHLALIEVGREVVTLRTPVAGSDWLETRLWVVDHDGAVWLHSGGAAWSARFEGEPIVELERNGDTRQYRARLDETAHPVIDRLLREKYGVADRWVRFISPCGEGVVPARLGLRAQ